jgi:hypothetical protein
MHRTLISGVLCLVVIAYLVGGKSQLSAQTPNPPAPTLVELCKQHPTDKCPHHHNYVAFYEALFSPLRKQKLRLLEIGVLDGHSLRLWEAYFSSAQIFGLDIESKSQHDTLRIKTFVADQGKREDLAKALAATGSGFDIILDDGGHKMNQQQISFATLFPALKSGALYILEDVHTSFPHLYPGYGVGPGGENSTYAMIDRFVRTGEIRSKYLTNAENHYLSSHISHCMYFWRSTRVHSDFLACWKK